MTPRHFKTRVEFREWLSTNHAAVRELWVGFYKKSSGKVGLTYPEAVDEALCFGWIDGIIKRVDEASFMHRFTPRTRSSSWSLTNTRRVGELTKLGLMAEAGLKAFRERDFKRSGIYLYEQRDRQLAPAYRRTFRAKRKAWAFFQAQPPGYKRLAIGWIMAAKRDETREKRLTAVVAASAKQTRVRWM